jgi:hypothetical protein
MADSPMTESQALAQSWADRLSGRSRSPQTAWHPPRRVRDNPSRDAHLARLALRVEPFGAAA